MRRARALVRIYRLVSSERLRFLLSSIGYELPVALKSPVLKRVAGRALTLSVGSLSGISDEIRR